MEKAINLLGYYKTMCDCVYYAKGDNEFKKRADEIDEAIKELEEAMKPKTCLSCKKYHKGTYPDDCYCDEGISTDEDFQILEYTFYCNRYEAKEH